MISFRESLRWSDSLRGGHYEDIDPALRESLHLEGVDKFSAAKSVMRIQDSVRPDVLKQIHQSEKLCDQNERRKILILGKEATARDILIDITPNDRSAYRSKSFWSDESQKLESKLRTMVKKGSIPCMDFVEWAIGNSDHIPLVSCFILIPGNDEADIRKRSVNKMKFLMEVKTSAKYSYSCFYSFFFLQSTGKKILG